MGTEPKYDLCKSLSRCVRATPEEAERLGLNRTIFDEILAGNWPANAGLHAIARQVARQRLRNSEPLPGKKPAPSGDASDDP